MNTLVATGTVGGGVQLSPDGSSVSLNIVVHRSWVSNGEVQHNRAVIHGTYKFKDSDEADKVVFEKGSRVGFKGNITGEARPSNRGELQVNGPHIQENAKGEPFCYFEADLTALSIIGAKAKSQNDFEDIFDLKLWGFLGRDPEARYTTTQQLVVSTSIAFNYVKYESNGDGNAKKVEQTIWWNLAVFGKTAEKLVEINSKTGKPLWEKGKALIVEGTLSANQSYGGPNIWQGKDGENRANYEFVVGSWCYAPGKREGALPFAASANQGTTSDEEIPF